MNAAEFCKFAHDGQFRMDGVTPFWTHPYQVVEYAKEFIKPDSSDYQDVCDMLYLHDVIEDTPYDLASFNENVQAGVISLTDPTMGFKFKCPRGLKLELQLHNTTIHRYGPFGKLCDRRHNIQNLVNKSAPVKWGKKYSHETWFLINFYHYLNRDGFLDFSGPLNQLEHDMLLANKHGKYL